MRDSCHQLTWTPETLPAVYLEHLDISFDTVQDGDELHAKFIDTFQDACEKPSANLQVPQVALNLVVKRGVVSVAELSKSISCMF